MTTPTSACSGVSLLLLLFVLCQDLVGVPITPRHAIGIRDPNVKDCRLPGFLKSMDSDVASKVPVDWCVLVSFFLQGGPTSIDGSSETAEGFRARAHISPHSAATSSWRCRMRPMHSYSTRKEQFWHPRSMTDVFVEHLERTL
jgi:hypothetical protein